MCLCCQRESWNVESSVTYSKWMAVCQTGAALMEIADLYQKLPMYKKNERNPHPLMRKTEHKLKGKKSGVRSDRNLEESLIYDRNRFSPSFSPPCCWMGWCHHSGTSLSYPLMPKKMTQQQMSLFKQLLSNIFMFLTSGIVPVCSGYAGASTKLLSHTLSCSEPAQLIKHPHQLICIVSVLPYKFKCTFLTIHG